MAKGGSRGPAFPLYAIHKKHEQRNGLYTHAHILRMKGSMAHPYAQQEHFCTACNGCRKCGTCRCTEEEETAHAKKGG